MSTEELPADLDKLKITPKHENIKLRARNPFYSTNTALNTALNAEAAQTTRHHHCTTRRIRRRSESNLDDFNNKQVDTVFAADNCEIVNPLRTLAGVHKLQLKRNNISALKRNLLREPILRIVNDGLNAKNIFGSRINARRMIPLNLDEKSRTNFHKPRANSMSIKSNGNLTGTSGFRDLISECNILLDESNSKQASLENNWHQSKNFMIRQKGADKDEDGLALNLNLREQQQQRPTITSSARLSCSQEASNTAPTSGRNCDDVTIVELASYFDTIVHIPKKMSTMAEMMYI